MLYQIFTIVAPIFACAAIGFIWARKSYDFDSDSIGKLVMNIGAPCLVFSTMTKLEVSTQAFSSIGLAAATALAIICVLGYVALRLLKQDPQTYLPSMLFSNCGNMGLPLCYYAFGDEGLALSMVIFACLIAVHLSIGLLFVSGRNNLDQVLKAPILYAVVIAFGINVMDLKVPDWLFNTTDLLGGMAIPLMLLVLGVSLASLRISTLVDAFKISVAKLSLGFIVSVVIAMLFPLSPVAKGVLILQLSMPVAVFNYIIAKQFNRGPAEIASLVVVSTGLSFLTLPVLLWLLLNDFPASFF